MSHINTQEFLQGVAWDRHLVNFIFNFFFELISQKQVTISMAKAHVGIKNNKGSRRDNVLDEAFTSEQVGFPVGGTLPIRKSLRAIVSVPLNRILWLYLDDFALWKVPEVIHELVTLFVNDFRKWFWKSSLIDHHLYFHLWKCLKPALTALQFLHLAGCMTLMGIRRTQRPRHVGAVPTMLHLSHL